MTRRQPRRGNSLDVFWQEFGLAAKARGSMLLLVDMPRANISRLMAGTEGKIGQK